MNTFKKKILYTIISDLFNNGKLNIIDANYENMTMFEIFKSNIHLALILFLAIIVSIFKIYFIIYNIYIYIYIYIYINNILKYTFTLKNSILS